MAYTKHYPGGWKNSPDTSTPITAAALENIENGLVAAASQINGVAISGSPVAGQVPTASGPSAATWQTPTPGFINPMTTLGDTMYEDATPAAARLAGNTTTARKFLRQKGTGSVSAAPAWDTLALADIAVAFPWRFYVDDPAYGALGDGKVVSDVSTTASSAVITSASAGFIAGDVGKYVMINGANGITSGPLLTTISSFQSATQVTLATTAGATATNCQMVWGTDDRGAIQAAVDAAGTYAQANSYFAEVVFGAKVYILGSGPTQTGNGTTTPTFNTQVALPYPNANGTTRKLVIALTGPGNNGFVQYWQSTTPNLAGACLVSMKTAPVTPSATFGIQSVIGGPSGSAGFTGGFANVKAVVKGIQVVCGVYTNLYAVDFGYVSAARVEASSALAFAPSTTGTQPRQADLPPQAAFQATIGSGFRFPVSQNNADTTADEITVAGFARSYWANDHFTAGRMFSFYSDVALKLDATLGGSGVNHIVAIQNLSAEEYNGGISINGGNWTLDINLDAEVAAPVYDINGPTGVVGVLHFTDPATVRNVSVTGCANLKIVDDNLKTRGFWSGAPAVPATGVATTPVYRDAMVQVTGGTVSQIAIDGQNTGLISGTFFVPSGKTVTITYSAVPTVRWWLT